MPKNPFPPLTHIHSKQIHAHLIKSNQTHYPSSSITNLLLSYSFHNLPYASKLFSLLQNPSTFLCNTIIRAHSNSSTPLLAFSTYKQMLHSSIPLNTYTFPFLLNACAHAPSLTQGRCIHAQAFKLGLHPNVFVDNALMQMYGRTCELDFARQVFDEMLERDLVSWNTMIGGYVYGENFDKAIRLFERMREEKVTGNEVTVVNVLSACARAKDLRMGRHMNEYIRAYDVEFNVIVGNAFIDMYAKCGSLEDACAVFYGMSEKRDVFSWNSMVSAYVRHGSIEMARVLFDEMPERNVVSWTSMIAGYAQNKQPEAAISLFKEMQLAGVKPDEVAMVSVLSACADLGALDQGRSIHVHVSKNGIRVSSILGAALIDMYAKCGSVEEAFKVFHRLSERDVNPWTTMINGLAMHGHGESCLGLFSSMERSNTKPNQITFVGVLSACSHTGLVDEGFRHFCRMSEVYGIEPCIEHYGCMVDLLGRAGLLTEAQDFIEKMPIKPNAGIWGALLGACRIHGNVGVAERAARFLIELEPHHGGRYVLISNIYAAANRWDEVTKVRKMMKDRGIEKAPGWSWIEIDGVVSQFIVGFQSHPQAKEIKSMLDEIGMRVKEVGYEPQTTHTLFDIEEEEKEHALYYHSEKLAIAFGLINTKPKMPIRIMKNLRVCGDCHTVTKLISKVYDRVIIVRDRNRFHHFVNGSCSCKDYW
ncbi:hypothetical protein AMTRI_Chr08g162910 [Amborella trichopoda]